MILHYNFDKPGYIGNVRIYDAAGYPIRVLSSNELMANTGVIFWDGLNESGQPSRIGIYIISGEFFHEDGTIIYLKKVVTLSDYLK